MNIKRKQFEVITNDNRLRSEGIKQLLKCGKQITELKGVFKRYYCGLRINGNRVDFLEIVNTLGLEKGERMELLEFALKLTKQYPVVDLKPYMESYGVIEPVVLRYYNRRNSIEPLIWIEEEEKENPQEEILSENIPIFPLDKRDEIIDVLYKELTILSLIEISKEDFIIHFNKQGKSLSKIIWGGSISQLVHLFNLLKEMGVCKTNTLYFTLVNHFVNRKGIKFKGKSLSSEYSRYSIESPSIVNEIDPILEKIEKVRA